VLFRGFFVPSKCVFLDEISVENECVHFIHHKKISLDEICAENKVHTKSKLQLFCINFG